jgi:hypothetical protein
VTDDQKLTDNLLGDDPTPADRFFAVTLNLMLLFLGAVFVADLVAALTVLF